MVNSRNRLSNRLDFVTRLTYPPIGWVIGAGAGRRNGRS
jgi:hypothetical protein